jgi:hypothetical protein
MLWLSRIDQIRPTSRPAIQLGLVCECDVQVHAREGMKKKHRYRDLLCLPCKQDKVNGTECQISAKMPNSHVERLAGEDDSRTARAAKPTQRRARNIQMC